MSSNPTTAGQQGRDEAYNAIQSASGLGFSSGSIIYYDMEGYSSSSTTQACRDAVKAFINGWTNYLSENEWYSGVYGSTYGSYASDWASISRPPSYVWLAVYDGRPTTVDLAGVSNQLWANAQRIHQFNGTTSRTYGGVTLSVDDNCANGRVAGNGHGDSSNPAC